MKFMHVDLASWCVMTTHKAYQKRVVLFFLWTFFIWLNSLAGVRDRMRCSRWMCDCVIYDTNRWECLWNLSSVEESRKPLKSILIVFYLFVETLMLTFKPNLFKITQFVGPTLIFLCQNQFELSSCGLWFDFLFLTPNGWININNLIRSLSWHSSWN